MVMPAAPAGNAVRTGRKRTSRLEGAVVCIADARLGDVTTRRTVSITFAKLGLARCGSFWRPAPGYRIFDCPSVH